MIANRPQIDRPRRRRDCCVLDCLLMGGPFLALPMAVGHNGIAVDTHQHRPVHVAH